MRCCGHVNSFNPEEPNRRRKIWHVYILCNFSFYSGSLRKWLAKRDKPDTKVMVHAASNEEDRRAMDGKTDRRTAEIHQFPLGRRAASKVVRDHRVGSAAVLPVARLQARAQVPVVEFGGCWYHDAAMQDGSSKR